MERPGPALGSNSAFVYDFYFNEFRKRYALSEDRRALVGRKRTVLGDFTRLRKAVAELQDEGCSEEGLRGTNRKVKGGKPIYLSIRERIEIEEVLAMLILINLRSPADELPQIRDELHKRAVTSPREDRHLAGRPYHHLPVLDLGLDHARDQHRVSCLAEQVH